MRKTVTLKLSTESDFESVVFAEVGKLLSDIEDSAVFSIDEVKVDDVPNMISLPSLRSEDVQSAIRRSNYRSSY